MAHVLNSSIPVLKNEYKDINYKQNLISKPRFKVELIKFINHDKLF